MNPEAGLEHAVKHNPAWINLWRRTEYTPATAPTPMSALARAALSLDPDLLREAYNEAWNAGHQAGEREGARHASLQGGDEGASYRTSRGKPQEGIVFVCLEHGVQPFRTVVYFPGPTMLILGCDCTFKIDQRTGAISK